MRTLALKWASISEFAPRSSKKWLSTETLSSPTISASASARHGLGRGRRGDVGLGRGAAAAPPGRRERLPVGLAAGHHRDLGELLDVPRHHVPGQPAAQRGADPLGVDRRARDGAVVGDQLGEAGCRLVGAHHGLPDAGHLQQHGLDLRELDAEAADLDLGVGTPDEAQALGVGADEVAAAVGAVPVQRGQRRNFAASFSRPGSGRCRRRRSPARRCRRPPRGRRSPGRRRRGASRRAAGRCAPARRLRICAAQATTVVSVGP